jgi:hypothetical protein
MEHYLKPLARYFAKGGRGPKTPAPRAGQAAWGRKPERTARRAEKPAATKTAARKTKPAAGKPAARKALPKPATRKLHAPARSAARKKAAPRRSRK